MRWLPPLVSSSSISCDHDLVQSGHGPVHLVHALCSEVGIDLDGTVSADSYCTAWGRTAVVVLVLAVHAAVWRFQQRLLPNVPRRLRNRVHASGSSGCNSCTSIHRRPAP